MAVKLSIDSAMVSMLFSGGVGLAFYQGNAGAQASPYPAPTSYRVASTPSIMPTLPGKGAVATQTPIPVFGQLYNTASSTALAIRTGDKAAQAKAPTLGVNTRAPLLDAGETGRGTIQDFTPELSASRGLESDLAPSSSLSAKASSRLEVSIAAAARTDLVEPHVPDSELQAPLGNIGKAMADPNLLVPTPNVQPSAISTPTPAPVALIPLDYDLAAVTPERIGGTKGDSAATGRASSQPMVANARSPRAQLAPQRAAAPATRKGKGAAGGKRYAVTGDRIDFSIQVSTGDSPLGFVPLRISADQTISLKLKDLLSLFEASMDSDIFARLDASASADEYVTFGKLRAAGIDLRYDPAHDRITIASESNK